MFKSNKLLAGIYSTTGVVSIFLSSEGSTGVKIISALFFLAGVGIPSLLISRPKDLISKWKQLGLIMLTAVFIRETTLTLVVFKGRHFSQFYFTVPLLLAMLTILLLVYAIMAKLLLRKT